MSLKGIKFDIFEEKNEPKISTVSDLKYNEVNIAIYPSAMEESKKHIVQDYEVLKQEGIENIIKKKFIPWLKGEEFPDRDDNEIFMGMEIYQISYIYSKIAAKYSPTGEENFFGRFEFSFVSSNDYTSDMLEAVAMEVYVYDGRIVKVRGYDI